MTDTLRAARGAALLLAAAVALGACTGDGTGPSPRGEAAVVLNSVAITLTVVPVDGETGVRTIALSPEGTPTTLAVRGHVAVVPLGTFPRAAVVDLATGSVERVPLPEGSGATGVAFLNDSIAVVANPDLNSVTPVNVLRGTTGGEIAVGTYPQRVVAHGGRVYVINANLENFAPAGPGSVTVIGPDLQVEATFVLSGVNSGSGVVSAGRLYVLHSGRFGAGDGSLSVVDLGTPGEIAHHTGFGEFPGSIAASPVGDLYVGSWGGGVVVWSPLTSAFLHPPGDPLVEGAITGIGFDDAGSLWATDPTNCMDEGRLLRLADAGVVEREVLVGVCPLAIRFAELPQ